MRKSKKRVELILTIITAVFFIAATVLFFLIPTLDNAFDPHPAGLAPYNPLDLFVAGIMALVSFNFASTKYILIFAVGALIIVLLLVWLIFIIAKKKPVKLVFWFLVLIMVAAASFMVSGLVMATCRTVTVYGKGVLDQTVFDDLRKFYDPDPNGTFNGYVLDARVYKEAIEANGYNVATVVISAAVIFHTDIRILAWVVLGCIGLVGLFGVLIPIFGIIATVKKEKVLSYEETEEQRAAREAREAEEKARQEREAQYVAYVEYAAGKEAREKEYRELCAAHGIKIEDESEAYYKEMSKLPVFKGEVVDEDEEYYKRLAKELGVLNGSVVPSDDEAYYKQLKKELPALQEQNLGEETDEEYVRRLSKELPALQEQNLSEGETEEEYIARLSKELPALKAQVLESPEDHEKYVARLSKELPLFKNGQHLETEEERVARLSKELPILHQEEEKGESEDEYRARLAKELPILNQKEQPKKEDYHDSLTKELALFRLIDASREAEIGRYYRDIIKELNATDQLREAEDEELAENLRRSVRIKREYYKKMKAQLPLLNRETMGDDE